MRLPFVAAVSALVAFAPQSQARTWRVERDGSGEFTVIQDAVNAAADGDTIRIGPGRYDDWGEVHAPAWTEQTIVWVNKDDLVFIGAGAGLTHVGPDVYYEPHGELPKVMCCVDSYSFTVEDLTVENCREGVYAYGRLEMRSCCVNNCEVGVAGFTEGGMLVDDTDFVSHDGTSYAIATYSPADNILVSHALFRGEGHGSAFSGADNVRMINCDFGCTRTNIMFYGAIGEVRDCTVSEGAGQGLVAGYNADVEIDDCLLSGRVNSLETFAGSRVSATNCEFTGGPNHPTIYAHSTSQMEIHDCHILNGGNLSVKLEYFSGPFIEQDLTGNYWGTTDTAQIDAWIWDQHDDPAIHAVVDYRPIADGPVETEAVTWGAVKTLFRQILSESTARSASEPSP